uniref:class B sortase n=2 Tax=Clostridia TaxID=186801 RepID=UPI003079B6A3
DNILVYGHNMKDGTMFSDLLQYKRESFWQQHRIIQFDTLTAQAEYTVMAVFQGEAEDLFAYYQFANAETPQEFAAYVDACKGVALYETGVSAAYGDKLITLSTCDDSGKNSRVVVVAKRITEPR